MMSLPRVPMYCAIAASGGLLSGWFVFVMVNKLYVMSSRFRGGRREDVRRGPLSTQAGDVASGVSYLL